MGGESCLQARSARPEGLKQSILTAFPRSAGRQIATLAGVIALGASSLTAAETFVSTDSVSYARREHTATLLSTGKVLLAGGIGFNLTARSELYDPATRIWSLTGAMTKSRRNHSATLLPDGRVLAAGGFDDYGAPAQAELYDPDLGTWAAAGSLVNIRNSHSATLLPNGKVLIVGGRTTADGTGATYPTRVEIFDPKTVSWTSTGAISAGRANHTATLLPSGKVLVTGGYKSSYLSSSVLYDPVAGVWIATGSLATSRAFHTATLLSTGKVLVTGGYNGSFLAGTEIYNPATGTWSGSGTMASARRNHTATPVAGDKILIVAGASSATSLPTVTEFFDPATGTCTTGPALVFSRELHTATPLPSGAVLVAGGSNSYGGYLGSSELYDPPTVTTPSSSLITVTTARIGGNVTKIGSAAMIERGVVYAPSAGNSALEIGGTGVTTVSTSGTTGTFTVNLTGLVPGTTYSFRAYATNGVGAGYSANRSFTTLTSLETWRKTWYGVTTNTGNAANEADPHHTGIPNLVAFAFIGPGQNPAQAKPAQLPRLRIIGGIPGYAFAEPAGVGNMVYGAETSPDLAAGSWQPLIDSGNASGLHTFTIPAVSGTHGFIRLRVSEP